MQVRVLRAFCIRGERQEPNKVINVSELDAVSLIAMGKAERVAGEPAPVSGPMTTESTAPLVKGKAPRKGETNAPE